MPPNPHPETLFHLKPTNQTARDALLHPDNQRFISSFNGRSAGLEVGFHVPSKPGGHVITRLGRDADLILRQVTSRQPMSATHVAFEINPATQHVLLSVRSKRLTSVTFQIPDNDDAETITGGGVILYGQNYEIRIASYEFSLVWRPISEHYLKRLTVQGFQSSLQRVQGLRSRDRPTEVDGSEALSWHITRFNTAKLPLFQDMEKLRVARASGAFGKVFEAVDRSSGYLFAIKVVDLASNQYLDIEAARAVLHREIKIMERLNHDHIIEYLGHQLFHTPHPEIFMPLRDGTLTSLVKSPDLRITHENLGTIALQQMLCALDYLANENIVHRDIKPDNILYSKQGDNYYHFQLADFGLAHHCMLAKTICGTGYYQAPELHPQFSNVYAGQSPKLDIWSLFASIVAVQSAFQDFPPKSSDYHVVLRVLEKKYAHALLRRRGLDDTQNSPAGGVTYPPVGCLSATQARAAEWSTYPYAESGAAACHATVAT
ncbi:kinase [Hirsutella rhossiliensis]|uniref:non-specific serine/threonine protein kinase n=1 Tax=Hirsutella rhossiliensis TaxID=111463 RepID=A0A9P8N6X0_9HYPO|nr:kinase [Hirsutella rhossiliensis]KAH0967869.1 kinase [Hirsutella rhossiliensis]